MFHRNPVLLIEMVMIFGIVLFGVGFVTENVSNATGLSPAISSILFIVPTLIFLVGFIVHFVEQGKLKNR